MKNNETNPRKRKRNISQVDELLDHKKRCIRIIGECNDLINECKKLDNNIEIQLAKVCEHEWKYYPPVCLYDSGSRVCIHCNLDKTTVISHDDWQSHFAQLKSGK